MNVFGQAGSLPHFIVSTSELCIGFFHQTYIRRSLIRWPAEHGFQFLILNTTRNFLINNYVYVFGSNIKLNHKNSPFLELMEYQRIQTFKNFWQFGVRNLRFMLDNLSLRNIHTVGYIPNYKLQCFWKQIIFTLWTVKEYFLFLTGG